MLPTCRERTFLQGRVGLCPAHNYFVWLVDGGAIIEHQYRDKVRAGQGMDFAADPELKELRQMLLSSCFHCFRFVAGVDKSLVVLVAVVMSASVGAPADVQLHEFASLGIWAAPVPIQARSCQVPDPLLMGFYTA